MTKIVLVAGLLDSGDIPFIIEKNLKELGHEVYFQQVDRNLSWLEKYLFKKGKRHSYICMSIFSYRLYRNICRINPEVVLIRGSNWAILPRTMEKIKRKVNCKIVLWEGNLQFWRWFQSEALQYYDIIFVNDSYAIPMLKGPARINRVVHLPLNMCDPEIHCPIDLTEAEKIHYGSDIGFIGMGHPERREFFENLTGFDLKLWGKNWDQSKNLKPFFVNEPVGMKEKIRIYQCAKINVNIQSKTYQINGISEKIFEIASCGGFFLTEKKRDLSLFFKEEEGLISFSSIDELKKKIIYYLANPHERKELAKNIREKVINHFTYKHKLRDLLNYVKA
jgi:spore maturation protein CgeB